jgi:serine/threonine-protein kinase
MGRRSVESEVGQVVGGYRLEKLIAAGSVARVYLGVHERLRRRAAIKLVALEDAEDPHLVERVVTEARVVNAIRHPSIIDISDIVECEAPRRIALVMELIEGPSLRAVIEERQRLSFVQAMGIGVQLAEALGAAHSAGVVHRDIKPANLLLASEPDRDPQRVPKLKVVDFGIAKLRGATAMTAAGIMIGTPAYMAPEQITASHPPMPATDTYAVAEVLWELLTGRRLYPRGSLSELVKMKARGELPEMPLPDVPGAVRLRSTIIAALARDPYDRPELPDIRGTLLDICPEAQPVRVWPRKPSPRAQPIVQSTDDEVTVYEATLEMFVPR